MPRPAMRVRRPTNAALAEIKARREAYAERERQAKARDARLCNTSGCPGELAAGVKDCPECGREHLTAERYRARDAAIVAESKARLAETLRRIDTLSCESCGGEPGVRCACYVN